MAVELVPGADGRILLVADHAGNRVPPGIDLGIDPLLLGEHIAVDLGVDPLTRALAARLRCPAILGTVSRLVADCNRAPDGPGLAPAEADGVAIPGNCGLDAAALAAKRAIHACFHTAIEAALARRRPTLIVSVHSFTPALATDGALRPWPVGILWNRDARGALPAIAALEAEPAARPVGRNQPYSGRTLNYTMDRHAEALGIASTGIEVRQDQLRTAAGVDRWAAILARVIVATLAAVEAGGAAA